MIAEQGDCLIPSAEIHSQKGSEEKGRHEPFSITTLNVLGIQRLCTWLKQPRLKFVLTVTIQTEGKDKVGRISYEVPLTTHLLNND